MNEEHNSPVVNNTELHRYELKAGGAIACLEYSMQGGSISLDHTHVPDAMRGKGAGAILVRAALADAKQNRWSIIPKCTFVAAFLRKRGAVEGAAEGTVER